MREPRIWEGKPVSTLLSVDGMDEWRDDGVFLEEGLKITSIDPI